MPMKSSKYCTYILYYLSPLLIPSKFFSSTPLLKQFNNLKSIFLVQLREINECYQFQSEFTFLSFYDFSSFMFHWIFFLALITDDISCFFFSSSPSRNFLFLLIFIFAAKKFIFVFFFFFFWRSYFKNY